jgi:hypothetical protein
MAICEQVMVPSPNDGSVPPRPPPRFGRSDSSMRSATDTAKQDQTVQSARSSRTKSSRALSVLGARVSFMLCSMQFVHRLGPIMMTRGRSLQSRAKRYCLEMEILSASMMESSQVDTSKVMSVQATEGIEAQKFKLL